MEAERVKFQFSHEIPMLNDPESVREFSELRLESSKKTLDKRVEDITERFKPGKMHGWLFDEAEITAQQVREKYGLVLERELDPKYR